MMGLVELAGDDIRHIADNKSATAFFGRTEEAKQGHTASDSGVPTDHIAFWADRYREAAKTGMPVSFRYAHGRKAALRWLEATVSAVDADRFTYVVADVTDRVARDEELQAAAGHHEALIRALPDLLLRLARCGTYIDVHAPDESTLAAPVETLLGRRFQDFLPTDLAAQFERAIAESLDRGEVVPVEYDLAVDGGETRAFEARVSPDTGREEVLIVVRDQTEAVAARRDVAATAKRLQALVSNLQAAVLVEDENGRVLLTNERFCDLFGVDAPPEALAGADCRKAAEAALPLFADPEGAIVRIQATLEARETVLAERVEFHDGRVLERDYVPISLDEHHGGHLWLYHDVTARVEADARLRDREAHYRLLAENGRDLVALHTLDGTFEWASPSAEFLLGRRPGALARTSLFDIVHPDDIAEVRESFRTALASGSNRAVYRVSHADGRDLWFETLTTPVRDAEGEAVGLQTASRDVTERHEMEERLYAQAFHDALTGLPNRVLFAARLEEAIAEFGQGEGYAVLYLDLDRFKVVNDTLGHSAGDQLLVEVGRRLRTQLRASDVVARLGGDEFAVLLVGLPDDGYAEAVAERLAEALRSPIEIDRRAVYAGASIGVVVGQAGHDQPDALLGQADLAMYEAKAAGRGGIALYSGSVHEQTQRRLRLEMDLRHAVERDELRVLYQPIVRLNDGALAGFEALVRWEHPEFGMLAPDAFLAPAAESGQLAAIDSWVVGEACRTVAVWDAARPGRTPLRVHVNFTGPNLLAPGFSDDVLALAASIGPNRLSLEITEHAVIDEVSMPAVLRQLRDGGVGCSLDDFGTGYSSLSTLHALPVDSVKVDRSFVQGVPDELRSRQLVDMVVHLGRIMDKSVVAEGIEEVGQLQALRDTGCDYGQGYLFDRPLSRDHATALATAEVAPWHHHWAA